MGATNDERNETTPRMESPINCHLLAGVPWSLLLGINRQILFCVCLPLRKKDFGAQVNKNSRKQLGSQSCPKIQNYCTIHHLVVGLALLAVVVVVLFVVADDELLNVRRLTWGDLLGNS